MPAVVYPYRNWHSRQHKLFPELGVVFDYDIGKPPTMCYTRQTKGNKDAWDFLNLPQESKVEFLNRSQDLMEFLEKKGTNHSATMNCALSDSNESEECEEVLYPVNLYERSV